MATVCIGDVSVVWLDSLVRACTAFPSLEWMVRALDRVYVPTIYPSSRRKRALRRALVSMGYSVWPVAK